LKQNEAIYPNTKKESVGIHKNELVFPRTAVQKLATVDGWKRVPRSIIENEIPFKLTCKKNKSKQDPIDDDRVPNELFGLWQTKPYEQAAMVNVHL
jgi:hypothetical protein